MKAVIVRPIPLCNTESQRKNFIYNKWEFDDANANSKWKKEEDNNDNVTKRKVFGSIQSEKMRESVRRVKRERFVPKTKSNEIEKSNILCVLCKHSYHVAPSDIIVDNILRIRWIYGRIYVCLYRQRRFYTPVTLPPPIPSDKCETKHVYRALDQHSTNNNGIIMRRQQ